MTKHSFVLSLFLIISVGVNALNNNAKADIFRLDEALAQRQSFEAEKRHLIDSLDNAVSVSDKPFEIYKKLYLEYRTYNYDTALIYVKNMQTEATINQRPEVNLYQAFVFMSGGLFKEASDILESWSSSDSVLQNEYMITYSRLLWDMADNAGGEIADRYNSEGNRLIRQYISRISPADTISYWYSRALLDLREHNYERSIQRCQFAMSASQSTVHQRAIMSSTLAYLYRLTGDDNAALSAYIEAAICDIKSLTYETVALQNIAELLFNANETSLADKYIHIALQDAKRYHARHRQVSIAQTLPIIEEQQLTIFRRQQFLAWGLLAVVAALLVISVGALFLLQRKNKALLAARLTISTINQNLVEANKIKEELLGTLLVGQSQYLNAVSQYQQDVRQSVSSRQWNKLLTIPKQADARIQRLALDRQLDNLLLSLYPTFVSDLNALMQPDKIILLKKGELLNTQMRIFALIRLGIQHNEVIAEILDCSINTVYSYKTRIIAQSRFSNDDFYQALMQIPSFSSSEK